MSQGSFGSSEALEVAKLLVNGKSNVNQQCRASGFLTGEVCFVLVCLFVVLLLVLFVCVLLFLFSCCSSSFSSAFHCAQVSWANQLLCALDNLTIYIPDFLASLRRVVLSDMFFGSL